MDKKIIKYRPNELIKRADNYLEHLNFLSPQKTDAFLIPYRKGNKWGFCTEDKRIVIDCIYEFVKPFSEGLAVAKLNNKFGFIDKSGDVKIPFSFKQCPFSFVNGMARVSAYIFNSEGEIISKHSYVNRGGELINEWDFDFIGDFGNELALIWSNKERGYINRDGKVEILLSPDVQKSDKFSNGLAKIQINDKWGYISSKGEIKIPCQYLKANDFSEGYAAISNGKKWGFIDTDGNMQIPLQYDDICTGFLNGMAMIEDNTKYGYINKLGNIIIPCRYNYLGEFSNGLAPVQIELDGPIFYINLQDDIVISGNFKEIFYVNRDSDMMKFSEGMAVIKNSEYECEYEGEYGYINISGTNIISCKYYYASPFVNGIASVGLLKKSYNRIEVTMDDIHGGYINKQGVEYWED